jgi:hypothetical protein
MRSVYRVLVLLIGVIVAATVHAQLSSNCVVSVLNRSARVDDYGFWAIPNVPANRGLVRVRATCVENGRTVVGQSGLVRVPANGRIDRVAIDFELPIPVPAQLVLRAPTTSLSTVGDTLQLVAEVQFPGGETQDATASASGTSYTTSNASIATVSEEGRVTASGSGSAIISATNDGALALIRVSVAAAGDADADGLPDDYEQSNGLDPNDPADATQDVDGDGLSNLQEFELGTAPRILDTDGDGVSDGLEVQTGSDPSDPRSVDLGRALRRIEIAPSELELVVNSIGAGEAFRQIAVTGVLLDGRTLDLTSRTRGTTYLSGDPSIANFGALDGRIFAGAFGTTTVTASNSGFTAMTVVTVRVFQPQPLAALALPGGVSDIRVEDGFAYVAAGAAGLVIVDVRDPASPLIVGSLDTSGTANAIAVEDGMVFVADGNGLHVVDARNPSSPLLVGSTALPGEVVQVAYEGGYAYLACGLAGMITVDVTDPVSPRVLSGMSEGNVRSVAVRDGLVAFYGSSPIWGSGTIFMVDVSRPAAPRLLGRDFGHSDRIVFHGNFLLLPSSNGLSVMDISDPTQPRLRDGVGGFGQFQANDAAPVGNIVFIADTNAFNAVPVVNISDPDDVRFQSTIDLRAAFGDHDATGVDADQQHVYLVSGNRLMTVRHSEVIDAATVAPTISIDAPTATTLVKSQRMRIQVSAGDDAGVASVRLIAGNLELTAARPPWEFVVRAPASGPLTLRAIATDFGGRTVETTRAYELIDDPMTSVSGIVTLPSNTPFAHATVRWVDGTTTTDGSGHYTFGNVPTAMGAVHVHATGTVGTVLYSGTTTIVPIPGNGTPPVAADIRVANIVAAQPGHVALTGHPNGMKVRDGFAYIASGAMGLQVVDVIDPSKPIAAGGVALPGSANDVELRGSTAFIAAGGAGLQLVDVTVPHAPRLVRSLSLPGHAYDLAVAPDMTAVAVGQAGLALVDTSTSVLSVLGIASVGETRAVAWYGATLVALTATELLTLDVTNPASPLVMGRIAVDDFWSLDIGGDSAYVTDLLVDVQRIDLRTVTAPVKVGAFIDNHVRRALPLNSYLFNTMDAQPGSVGVRETIANTPTHVKSISMLFARLTGTALDVDGRNVYVAGSADVISDGTPKSAFRISPRFYAKAHELVIDTAGVAPDVSVTAPADAIHGETISYRVSASDDVRLRRTAVTVNGHEIDSFDGATKTYDLEVEAGLTSIAIRAVAVDTAGNTAAAEATVTARPDPLTTLSGIVRTSSGEPLASARVVAGDLATSADASGAYSLPSVPTLHAIDVRAFGRLAGSYRSGTTNVDTFVRGGTTTADISVDAPPGGTVSSVTLSGYGNAVRARGRYAYIAAGAGGLQVVDVDDADAPVVVTTLPLPGQANDLVIDDARIYIAAGIAGVHVIDIADERSPQLIGTLDTPGDALELTLQGDHLYVADGPPGLQVLDIAGTPEIVGALATPVAAIHVSVEGDRLALVTEDSMLRIVDVGQPATPAERSAVWCGNARSVVLHGELVHVSADSQYQIFSIAQPDAPLPIGVQYGTAGSLARLGVTTAVADSSNRLFSTFDASDPTSPQYASQFSWSQASSGGATGLDLDSEYAYMTVTDDVGGSGPQATGNTRLVLLRHEITVDGAGNAPTVAVTAPSGSATVIVNSTVGLRASANDDVGVAAVAFYVDDDLLGTSKSAPYEIEWYPEVAGTYAIHAVAVDYAGASARSTTVMAEVVDDPLTTVTGVVTTAGGIGIAGARVMLRDEITETAPDGTFVFANVPTVDGAFTVKAAAVTNGSLTTGLGGPAEPVLGGTTRVDIVLTTPAMGELGTTSIGLGANARVAVTPSAAYVAESSVAIVDLRLPNAPIAAGFVAEASDANNVVVHGTQLFVAAGYAGVQLFDITNPIAPALVATFDTPGYARDVAVGPGGTLYIADAENGLYVLDVADPEAPVVKATLPLSNGANSIAASAAGYVLVTSAPYEQSSGGEYDPTSTVVSVSLIDVRTIAAPVVRNSFSVPGETARVAVQGTRAYLSQPDDGPVSVFDFDDGELILRQNITHVSGPVECAISGSALAVAGGFGNVLSIFNAAADPVALVRDLETPSIEQDRSYAVAIDGELAIVLVEASGSSHLVVIKFRNADGSL